MDRRKALRMLVVYRRVVCPFGRNDRDDSYLKETHLSKGDFWRSGKRPLSVSCEEEDNGSKRTYGPHRRLHDCYMDAVHPEHPCNGCKQVDVWKKTIGLRTYKLEPEATTVNVFGDPHHEHPMRIVFLPLTAEGTEWYALNIYSGERFEVQQTTVTITPEHGQPYRRYLRQAPEGGHIEQEFRQTDSDELARRVDRGGMVNIPYTYPIWSGVNSRDDWRCQCSTCTGEEKRMLEGKDEDEVETLMRSMNVNTQPRRYANFPSAPQPTMAMYGDRKVVLAPRVVKPIVFKKPEVPDDDFEPEDELFPTTHHSAGALKHSTKKSKPKDGDDFIAPSAAMSTAFKKTTKKKPEEIGAVTGHLSTKVVKESNPPKADVRPKVQAQALDKLAAKSSKRKKTTTSKKKGKKK